MIFSDEYEPLMHTLDFLSFKKLVYHLSLSAVLCIPNFLHNTSSRTSWSTVSKAADRSTMSIAVICLFSMAHRVSLTNFKKFVSQIWNFLYADWYSGRRLCVLQCLVSWFRVHFSIIF